MKLEEVQEYCIDHKNHSKLYKSTLSTEKHLTEFTLHYVTSTVGISQHVLRKKCT
jgi:hypothetical protein